jgi:glutathione S-transferase
MIRYQNKSEISLYKLYIANKNYSSLSLRHWVLMQEFSIPFDEKIVPFAEGSNWEAFRAFSPTGKVPCLHHDELVVWDSLAIDTNAGGVRL